MGIAFFRKVRKLFERHVRGPVHVEMIDSAALGNQNCIFRITIDGEPHPDIFSSDDLRAIITGRYRLDFSAESPRTSRATPYFSALFARPASLIKLEVGPMPPIRTVPYSV